MNMEYAMTSLDFQSNIDQMYAICILNLNLHSLFANHEPASTACHSFNVRPCASFHPMRPFALRTSTMTAVVLEGLKL